MARPPLRVVFPSFPLLALLLCPVTGGTKDVTDQPGILDDFEPPYAESLTKAPPKKDSLRTEAPPPSVRKAPKKRAKNARGIAPGIVSAPAGCFQMGSADSLAGENARPRHEVCLSAFRMDRIPVTQREYMLRTGVAPWEICEGYACTPPNPDHPAWFVTWFEADSFCRSVGGRLPTEAEYEYALRAGDSTVYPWGDSLVDACDNGNLADLTLLKISKNWRVFPCTDGSALVDIAGLRKPNRWGLYDMSGNVWAWVADWYSSTWYASSPKQDPRGPASGSGRVMRGGSWITGPDGARSAYRDGLAPNLRYFGAIGFRCVYPEAAATPAPQAR